MPNTQFRKAYDRLNPAQKQAVDTIEGPVMVVAGPGTGKTQVVATRIAQILQTQDVQPANILAITFTDSAAKNMRERVVSLIGTPGYYVTITTFHAFCSDIISQNPEYFDLDRSSQPLSDLERYTLFERLLTETALTVLKPTHRPLYYLNDVISQISNLKREGVTPEAFERIILAEATKLETESSSLKKTEYTKREKELHKWQELHTLYIKYQHELRNLARYDFDDMIMLVVEAFRAHEELLLTYQEQFQYILVDEYQDTNSAQNAVVDLLSRYWGNQANIFVVGDPHQSIYRFQGASVENMLDFLTRYPTATVITLTIGYRCPQELYDAAYSVISNNELGIQAETTFSEETDRVLSQALTTRLKGEPIHEQACTLYEAPSLSLEGEYVADSIQKLLSEGVDAHTIAVLYKNHSDSILIAESLEKASIPFAIDTGGNVLEDIFVNQLLTLFQVLDSITEPTTDSDLFEVLLYDWLELDTLTVMQLVRFAATHKRSLLEVIEMSPLQLAQQAPHIKTEAFIAVQAVKEKLEHWKAASVNLPFTRWFEGVVHDFGCIAWLASLKTNKKHLVALTTLYAQLKQWVHVQPDLTITTVLQMLAVMREHAIAIPSTDTITAPNQVQLSTVHKAKGREWDYVFIVQCRDKKWGNAPKVSPLSLPTGLLKHVDLSKKEKNEDDRRLFYVASTRAKKMVYLSYAKAETTAHTARQFVSSMFLQEIASHVRSITEAVTPQLSTHVSATLEKAFTPLADDYSAESKAFFTDIISHFSLSASALATYLQDPQAFVYSFLLKVPQKKVSYLQFGTAMHRALELWYKQLQRTGVLPSRTQLQEYFVTALQAEALVPQDYARLETKGLTQLEHYYEARKDSIVAPLFTERYFGGTTKVVLMDGELPIYLTGRVDRVEYVSSLQGARAPVRIVDYKTGSAKTVGQIEASTLSYQKEYSDREQALPDTIKGRYKRQLVFYALLAELDPTFTNPVAETVFEFLEPATSGAFVSRSFTITAEEITDLKTLIFEVMKELRSLQFLSYLS